MWQSDPPTKPANIYVLQCEDFIKVGITSNLCRRIRSLRSANPYPIVPKYYAYVAEAQNIEKIVHAELIESRVHLEWFKKDPETAIRIIQSHSHQTTELEIESGPYKGSVPREVSWV